MNYHSQPANTLNVNVVAVKKGRVLREIRVLAGFWSRVTNGNAERFRVLTSNATMRDLEQAVSALKQDFNAASVDMVMAPSVEKILLKND